MLEIYSSLFLSHLRRISTQITRNQRKNHYNVLGISPKATQADIKSAYYNLSKVYHPDKNQMNDAGAAEKFRDITTAYEVLGNVQSRRLYDRGLTIGPIGGVATDYPDTSSKFHQSREVRSRPPPPSGKTTVYDFDEWSRQHYGATFAKDMEHKRRQATMKRAKKQIDDTYKVEKMIMLMGALFLVSSIVFAHVRDYDVVRPGKKSN